MAAPDGFGPSKSGDKRRHVTAPKFESGFTKSAPSKGPLAHSSRPLKPIERPDFGAPIRKPSATKLQVLKPPGASEIRVSSSSKPLSRDGLSKPGAILSSFRPSNSAISEPGPSTTTETSQANKQKAVRRPPPLESIIPPRPTNLKPLPPPPPPVDRKRALDTSKFKTISTTRVARATDLNTESGSVELLSLFLGQHGTGFVDPVDRELKRGLEQSPEKQKGGKGKGKWIR